MQFRAGETCKLSEICWILHFACIALKGIVLFWWRQVEMVFTLFKCTQQESPWKKNVFFLLTIKSKFKNCINFTYDALISRPLQTMSPISTVEKSEKVKVQPQDWSNHMKTYLLVIPSRKTPGPAKKAPGWFGQQSF